jgi:hypothetical protein
VTEFEKKSHDSERTDLTALDTKKALTSKIYTLSFEDRKNFQRTLLHESSPKIVYHDFCKSEA